MRIESERLGALDVDDASVITFPRGLIGLPGRKRFVILEFGEGIPLGWMQCVDDGAFGLPVSDPQIFRPEYRVEASSPDVSDLELESAEDAVILVVTTVGAGGDLMTGNLRAPLLVNTRNRIGQQIVLDGPDAELRVEVDPLAFAQAVNQPGERAPDVSTVAP